MNTKRSNMTLMATIGGIILLVLLVGGIILLGCQTRTDTEDAVHSGSRMFLYELADREVALELMTEEDLQDTEHLQAYQARMKRIYTLEKFAFVDTDGLIYTSKGNQTNIDDYHFDYETISGPEISILNLASPDKKVIIAVPLDHLPFMGKEFVACFMEIDMEEMLSGLSLTSNNEGITFCNIYTEDGVALTNTVLGGLAMEDNLLEAMSHADYEAGYSYEKVTDDFAGGKAGEVSFVYNDINETLSYVPIEGTNWFLTYLLRESVLGSQIGSITDGILKRSFIYSLLIAAVLVFMFAYILIQTRRNARLLVEKETSEAESRVKQQNLEQQLALQNQLLEQEKMRAQQDNMITALSSDYRSVYYVDLDEDDAVCYLADKKSGEMIAVVGESGGGKTTLCQLIPRFYDVTEGSIRIDGTDIRNVTKNSLRSSVGIVQQEVFIFADTVRENIRYGRPDATDEEVIMAAREAEIYEDIMQMPDGFDTYVGERGTRLSGGQRQRISIARIFLKNPAVLILDEATSALDTVTEERIQHSFDSLMENRTSFVIAHRLSTVRNADRIIVIENGRVMEEGTHAQLLELGGEYAKLYEAQEL